jgi:hypothetical protein
MQAGATAELLRKQQQAETLTPAIEAAHARNTVLTHRTAPLIVNLYAGRLPLAAVLRRSRSFASCLTKRIAWIQRRSCWLASTGTRQQLAFFCSMAQILC